MAARAAADPRKDPARFAGLLRTWFESTYAEYCEFVDTDLEDYLGIAGGFLEALDPAGGRRGLLIFAGY